MANTLYDLGRQKFLEGSIAWLTDDIKVMLVDTDDYVFSQAHEFVDDVTGFAGAEIDRSGNLASKTSVGGVADADDIVIPTVSGDQFEAIIIFKDSGLDSTSPLIAFIDSGTGLPLTPNGGSVTLSFDSGADRIFKL